MPNFSIKNFCIMALMLCSFYSILSGYKLQEFVGGDSPVTISRLEGSKLVDIRTDVSLSFQKGFITIENNGGPIPPDLVVELLSNGMTPNQIEAKWQFDEKANTIELQDVTLDGETFASKPSIPIRPAGHLRVNLGSRPYNMFRNVKNESQ